MSGILYLCATPIGNLEDITLRALRILKEVNLIAAEDTRNSLKLLSHFDIHTELTSYHEHNKWEKGRTLIKKLKEGENVALITDAGMPAISDPGCELVQLAHEEGITVTVIPGATAGLSALAVSGLPSKYFSFEGFLPTENKLRRERLDKLKVEESTLIIYEAPHRLKKTLEDLSGVLGENRRAALAKELTKKHEAVLRGTLGSLLKKYELEEPKGEFVIVIEGLDSREASEAEQKQWEELSVKEHYKLYISSGMERQKAMKQTAVDRGLSKREIYKALVEDKE